MTRTFPLILFVSLARLFATDTTTPTPVPVAPVPHPTAVHKPAAAPVVLPPIDTAPQLATPSARKVIYTANDIITLHTRVRFVTMIVLPQKEVILDFIIGDKDFWQVNGNQNLAFVKPSRAGSSSNMELICQSGNVYSFLLREGNEPDMKVLVEDHDASLVTAIEGAPKYVPAAQVNDFAMQYTLANDARKLAEARATAAEVAAKQETADARNAIRENYPTTLKFDYRFNKNAPPFNVETIYHDDKFTYIKADPEETPTLYEEKDGKPSLVQFEFKNGIFTVSKIVDSGYLQAGKKKLVFVRTPEEARK